MPKVLGALFAVVALSVCILAGIEPWTATVRGIVAYAVGHLFGALWEGATGGPGGKEVTAQDLISSADNPDSEPDLPAEVA